MFTGFLRILYSSYKLPQTPLDRPFTAITAVREAWPFLAGPNAVRQKSLPTLRLGEFAHAREMT